MEDYGNNYYGNEERDINYREIIRGLRDQLAKIRDNYKLELKTCPEGSLWKTFQNGRTCYFWAHREGEVYVRKAISSDREMQQRLARKAYLRKSVKLLDKNIYQLNRTLKGFEPLECGAVVSRLTKAYQELPGEYFLCEGGQLEYNQYMEDIPRNQGEYV